MTWGWIKAVDKTNSFKSFKSGERKFSIGKAYSEQREAEAKSRYSVKMAERAMTQIFQGCSNELQTLGNNTQETRQHS